MRFTMAEIAVLETIAKMQRVFVSDSVGMYENNGPFSLHSALTYLWKQKGFTEAFQDVLKSLCKYQHVIECAGQRYRVNTLCTCGRRSPYVKRAKNVFTSKEAVEFDKIRIFGKMLNWSDEQVVKCDPVIDTDEAKGVRTKSSKQLKAKTSKAIDRVVSETSARLVTLQKLKNKALEIRDEIQELRGIAERVRTAMGKSHVDAPKATSGTITLQSAVRGRQKRVR